jgi:hypothetical protein
MTTFDQDAVIIGAGAAGLMAAIRAGERGRRVLLLEKGKKPGVKILMSGGTRCERILRLVPNYTAIPHSGTTSLSEKPRVCPCAEQDTGEIDQPGFGVGGHGVGIQPTIDVLPRFTPTLTQLPQRYSFVWPNPSKEIVDRVIELKVPVPLGWLGQPTQFRGQLGPVQQFGHRRCSSGCCSHSTTATNQVDCVPGG